MIRNLAFRDKACLAALPLLLSGCGAGIVAQAGPSASAVMAASDASILKGVQVIDVTPETLAEIHKADLNQSFAYSLGAASPVGSVVHQGDVLEVSIWEAPPAALFGGAAIPSRTADNQSVSSTSTLPDLLVGLSGSIFVPFVGNVAVVNRSTAAIEAEITKRLQFKAHLPQVVVRIVRNASADVTIVGEVNASSRMPLTPKGERVLDAIAHAGGTKQQSARMTIQITRGKDVVSMPLDAVIRDPGQNVTLATGDVISAVFQPFSLTVLGATGKNDELNFESTGLTLAQALGRIGGLQDQRANAKGIFVFRWESRNTLQVPNPAISTPDGRVPVIYRVNLRDPGSLFLAQDFTMKDRDIIYVANAPISEFQQFVNIIASTVLPLVAVRNSVAP